MTRELNTVVIERCLDSGYFVKDARGRALAYCFTRWGARWKARKILRMDRTVEVVFVNRRHIEGCDT